MEASLAINEAAARLRKRFVGRAGEWEQSRNKHATLGTHHQKTSQA